MALLFSYTVELHGTLAEVEAARLDEQLFFECDLGSALREVVEQKIAETSFSDRATYGISVKVLP
jgi:hypothetical protein